VRAPACPAAVITKARALLLYGVAVGVTSAAAPVLERVTRALAREYGAAGGNATGFRQGSRLAPSAAAFDNAVLLHVRIQDDAHPAGHMGTVILPAALALAEAGIASGADLLGAVIAGYEIALRIGRDHAADLSKRGFRTTPIYGTLGAAAACARVLGLDANNTMHALALSTHAACGLREFADAGTDEYPFQVGFAARSGLTSALLAAEGIAGTPTALTGRAGLYRAFGEPGRDYAARLLDELGTCYELERVTYKPYPGGQWHRGVIRALVALREQAPDAEIEQAEVRMNPFEAKFLGLDYNGPFSTYAQAFFSVPFCAALAWLQHTVSFKALNRFDDPSVLALVARIHVVSDEAVERYKPVIRIKLAGGAVLEWSDPPGEEIYNLTWDIAVEMTHALASEAGVARELADALVETVRNIEAAPDIAALVAAAVRVAAAARAAV
jgi:2-methylcitrate dehydratase PrpD